MATKAGGIEIRRVGTGNDWEEFLSVPFRLRADDPSAAVPLRRTTRGLLDVERNPFFRHSYSCPLIARREGRVVGRLVAFIDENHNRVHRAARGFFGFFDCENDKEAARALFAHAERWLLERGITRLRGPFSTAPHCDVGFRARGEGEPSAFTLRQPAYYLNLVEAAGFKRSKDLYLYEIDSEARVPERLLKHSDRLKKARGVSLRPLDERRWEAELETLRSLYNASLERHWAFTPLGRDEFAFLMGSLKPILDPELVLIAEVRGKPAGFALAIPDFSAVLGKVPEGRLGPKGLFQLLWNLKGPGRRRLVRRCRVLALGVKREFTHYGIGPLLYTEYLNRGPAAGYPVGVISDIPEDDGPMNRALRRLCGEPREVHRIYEKPLGQGGNP